MSPIKEFFILAFISTIVVVPLLFLYHYHESKRSTPCIKAGGIYLYRENICISKDIILTPNPRSKNQPLPIPSAILNTLH